MADWKALFDNFGIKVVSDTDKSRQAYVLSDKQNVAVLAAGRKPSDARPAEPFTVEVLFDENITAVTASYYLSMRDKEERYPEPRMGRELIRTWLTDGDRVIVGNIGRRLCVAKVAEASAAKPEDVQKLVDSLAPAAVLQRALRATGKPARRKSFRNDFVRNPYVVSAAFARAGGRCDMPGCGSQLFRMDSGENYLEVHHVVPLRDGGEDALRNACALCPMCHRRLHFSTDRVALQSALKASVLERYDPLTGNRRTAAAKK